MGVGDDFINAAVGPLQPPQDVGGQPGVPSPQPDILRQLLPKLLPALIMGTGAALSSPIRSAPLIAGRALMGAAQGWEAGTPSQKDLYYNERANREKAAWTQLQHDTADENAYVATLPTAEEKVAFETDKKGFMARKMMAGGRAENIAYLSMRTGIPRETFTAWPDAKLYDAFMKTMPVDARPIVKTVDVNGVPTIRAYDPRGNVLWTGDPAPSKDVPDAALDRSYEHRKGELVKLLSPVEAQAERMSRLIESVNQHTPQADALIAPELLTAMAGGQGSGLRMTEAEISRIVGGRTHWESLKAAANKWSTDPTKGLSITDDQRKQITSLAQAMHDRIQRKLKIGNDAASHLTDAKTVKEHRDILDDARRQLTAETDMGTVGESKAAAPADPLGIR